ncbi:IS66 family insertion sequence element accessory protein TnpA [Endozoicomonas ascidiicola]|uniref:IS66 family insertion sequence element accessory protein TnpA n=1 Tax=Endozoicomonas ascidiicola TaxID=1698521 RepID=UPI00082A637D|nr:hypothetical protein [Endozoicomonas ascidiicola]
MKAAQRKQLLKRWLQRIQDWQQSGLSQTAWCKQHQLNIHQLSYWKRKLSPKTESKVIPLAVAMPKPEMPSTLVLHINNVQVEATPEQAAILIHALQANP